MLNIVSTTWPWTPSVGMTPTDVVRHLVLLHADEVCIRTPVYYLPYNPPFHSEVVTRCLDEDIDVSLWPVVSLYNPELQADRIAEETEKWKPKRLFLDAERHWVLDYIANLPRFLNRLASHKLPCPIGLGSYRRASMHTGMNWQVWLKHQTETGYTIAFLAHQLYPLGWVTPAQWLDQFKRDVDSHEAEIARAGRPGMEWLPWMPSFIGGGFEGLPEPWVPSAVSMQAAVEYLVERLGTRLLGYNWWSLDKSLVDPRLGPVYNLVRSLNVEPPPLSDSQRVDILWREAATHGWNLT
jgi:hypothetical protein